METLVQFSRPRSYAGLFAYDFANGNMPAPADRIKDLARMVFTEVT